MAFVPFNHVLFASVRFLLDGQHIENGFHVDFGSAAFEDSATAVAGALEATWWADIRAQLTTALVHQETYIVDLDNQFGASATFPPFADPAGASTGNSVPNNVALCVTHRTAGRGRSFRGRSFVAGIDEASFDVSTINTTAQAAIAAAFNNLRTTLATDDLIYVVASREFNGAPRTTGVSNAITVSLVRDRVADSQRRRLPGRGT